MCSNRDLVEINCIEKHKLFYNNVDPKSALSSIPYSAFFDEPDGEFPYSSANDLLSGSCDSFALALHKLLNYSPYIIKEASDKGFHAFCQVYKGGEWYYVDARGMTTSFSEFVNGIKFFVNSEFIIRPVSARDIMDWKSSNEYSDYGLKFAEAFIERYNTLVPCTFAE